MRRGNFDLYYPKEITGAVLRFSWLASFEIPPCACLDYDLSKG
jgi:hypothetical protein